MNNYRKKPIVIEARQYEELSSPSAVTDLAEWCGGTVEPCEELRCMVIVIPTLEGNMTAQIYDWIIKGVKGEFYPCKPDIFDATYEKVD